MTEYEYFDLIVTSRDSVGYHAMHYIGVLRWLIKATKKGDTR